MFAHWIRFNVYYPDRCALLSAAYGAPRDIEIGILSEDFSGVFQLKLAYKLSCVSRGTNILVPVRQN